MSELPDSFKDLFFLFRQGGLDGRLVLDFGEHFEGRAGQFLPAETGWLSGSFLRSQESRSGACERVAKDGLAPSANERLLRPRCAVCGRGKRRHRGSGGPRRAVCRAGWRERLQGGQEFGQECVRRRAPARGRGPGGCGYTRLLPQGDRFRQAPKPPAFWSFWREQAALSVGPG